MTTLQHLYLASCQRHCVKANTKLCEVLGGHTASDLQSLDLSENYVGTEGGWACLMDVIAAAPKLEVLDIGSNYLQTENIQDLCTRLAGHPGIRAVKLNNNRLYIESGKELLRLVRQNRNITDVEVATPGVPNDNKIPEKIMNQITREVQINISRKHRRSSA
ncbi:putative calpain [Diplonema papillatum]|nr:putative calpain [Diplonema papillatum]